MDLETRVQAEALLLKAARTHGVQVRRDEVQQHLRDDHYGAALAEWASLHLTTDNLLSPDELAMYVWRHSFYEERRQKPLTQGPMMQILCPGQERPG